MEQASIDLQTRMTYALCIRIQYISLSSAYSRYRRDSAETSSSTGSRAWTDLNLEQRHDCNAPLRGNFICRPSRPWASSASRGRFENHPIFEVCIIDRWRRPFIIAGDRTLLPNSLPSPPSSTSFLSSILFQLPLSFLRQTRRKRRFDSLFTFHFSVRIVSFYHPCDVDKSMMLRDRVSRVKETVVRREWNWQD